MGAPATPLKNDSTTFFRARQPPPVHISPLLAPQDDVLFEAPSDLDSDDTRATKRRRREDAARIYLKTGIPNITTARLRGPFPSTWQNPWAKETKKQRIKTPRKHVSTEEKATPRLNGQEFKNGSSSRPKRTPIKLPEGLDHLDPHDKAQYARLKRLEENLQSQLQDHHARLESFSTDDEGVEEVTELMDAVKRSLARVRASLLKYRPTRAQTRLLTDGVHPEELDVSPKLRIQEKRKLDKRKGSQVTNGSARGYEANTPLRRAPPIEQEGKAKFANQLVLSVPQDSSTRLPETSSNDLQIDESHSGVKQNGRVIVPASTDKEPASVQRSNLPSAGSLGTSTKRKLKDLSIVKNSFGIPSSVDISPSTTKPPLLITTSGVTNSTAGQLVSGITPSTSNDAGISNLGRSPWLPEGQQIPNLPGLSTNGTDGSLSQIIEASLPERTAEARDQNGENHIQASHSPLQAGASHNIDQAQDSQDINASNTTDSNTSKDRFVTPGIGNDNLSDSKAIQAPEIEPQPSLPKFTIDSESTQGKLPSQPQPRSFPAQTTFLSAEDIDTSPDFTTLIANLGSPSAQQDAQKMPMPSFPDFLGSGLTTLSSSELDSALMDVEDILKGGTWSAEKEVEKLSR